MMGLFHLFDQHSMFTASKLADKETIMVELYSTGSYPSIKLIHIHTLIHSLNKQKGNSIHDGYSFMSNP